MRTLEQANSHAVALYRLAFILTGDRGRSLDATLEALDSHDDGNSFFSSWMLAWSRRLVVAKALAGIRDDLATSARRTASKRAEKAAAALPSRNYVPGEETTKVQLDSALLAIDVFPRCAVLLTVFEGVAVRDAAVLLDEDADLVRKAQIAGLQELTCNLARMQGWTATGAPSYVPIREMQHA